MEGIVVKNKKQQQNMQPAGIAKPGWLNYTMTLRVLPLGVRTAAAPPSARCIIIAGSTAVR